MILYEDQIEIYLEVVYLFINFCAQKIVLAQHAVKLLAGKKFHILPPF